tara:strand:- start:2374 stop:3543 length:1170 start_codon:yes stop_codon:yes gene_type:complete
MKILIIHNKYKIFGGEDSNIIDEIKLLRKENNVEYLEFDNNHKLNLFDFICFFTSNNYMANKLLKEKITIFKPDVVYVHNTWFKAGLGLFKIIKKSNTPVLLKIHNYRYSCARSIFAKSHVGDYEFCYKCGFSNVNKPIFNKYFKESWLKSILIYIYSKNFIKMLIKYDPVLVVLNNFQKNYIIKDIKSNKLNVLPNPIVMSKDIEQKYIPSSNYVIYAGSLSHQKGLENLLSSWEEANISKLTLHIIGQGPLKNKLEQKYRSNKQIKFLGYLNFSKTMDEIKKARAIITATRMYEGQPRLLSEASSLGIPSIFPHFGGMPEFFPKDYPLSFEQFNYDDLILKIKRLQDIEFLNQQSKEVTEHFSKIINNKLYLEKFKKLSLGVDLTKT